MERKNVVLLTVIAVATLLTAMVGSTFAFFTATVTKGGNKTDDAITATAATVTATYSEGSNISITGIKPDWTGSKDITIQNTSQVAIDYVISITGFSNTFANLQYTLNKKAGSDNNNEDASANITGLQASYKNIGTTNFNGTDNVVVKGHLGAGQKHVFTLGLKLNNLSSDQTTADANKAFAGTLSAEATTVKKA